MTGGEALDGKHSDTGDRTEGSGQGRESKDLSMVQPLEGNWAGRQTPTLVS